MKKSKEPSSEGADLRRRAEEDLDKKGTGPATFRAQEDNVRLLHELQVHQAELEIQNEELRDSREAVETALEQYTDLYDFAPVGYFTMDGDGVIRKSNLTGATLLGVQRSQLIGRRFEALVSEESRPGFNAFLRKMYHDAPKAACEVALPKEGQAPWYVRVDGAAMEPDTGKERLCRIAVTDITEHKRIEDLQLFLVNCGNERSDENFFRSLARYLAQSLEMDYVCIDRLEGDAQAAQTVAVYFDGKFEDNVAYTLKDTPCGDVAGKTICCFPKDVRHLFPRDAVLQEMMAESYAGTTLWGSDGQPIGLIAVIGRKPLVHPKLAESVLRMVALRAAHELERRVIDESLAKERANLQAVFDMVNVGMLVMDEAGCVQRVNSTLTRWINSSVPARGGGQPGDFIGCIHALADPEGCGKDSHCASCHIRRTFETAFHSGQPVHGVEAEAGLSVNGQNVSLWLEISADPLIMDGKRYVILAMNNITARKQAEAEVLEHIAELKAMNQELARFNRVAVDRELRMVELKKRVNELCIQAGQPAPYPLDFDKEG
jgi:PAS domain S-box-containing protein